MTQYNSLTSYQNLVQAPFIIVNINGFKFGNVVKNEIGNSLQIQFPNYIKSMQVRKINGELSTYVINLIYQIQPGDDPNKIDKIISTASDNREMTITYGDYESQSFVFKEEKAIITSVRQSVNFQSASISYTIEGTGTSVGLLAKKYNFNGLKCKPSDLIKGIIQDTQYGLQDVFTGFQNVNNIFDSDIINGNDKSVYIDSQQQIDIISYISYLVSCMVPVTYDQSQGAAQSYYTMSIVDNTTNQYGGSYFMVREISADDLCIVNESATNSSVVQNAYQIDIGFPGQNFVQEFSINSDNEYLLLYEPGSTETENNYQYTIDNDGNLNKMFSPTLMRSNKLDVMSNDAAYWAHMTNFPITATITMKGLVKPTILCSYVIINVVFFGRRHNSSGKFIVTGQTDTISDNGFTSQLELTRIAGITQ